MLYETQNGTATPIAGFGQSGESSSGGHTIVDQNGTELTQEDKLKFATMQVTDENGATVVRHVVKLTKDEYDILPDTKLTDNIIYEITDDDAEMLSASGVSYNDGTVADTLNDVTQTINKLEEHGGIILKGTLYAANWSSNSQTVTISGMTADLDGVVGIYAPDGSTRDNIVQWQTACGNAQIVPISQGENTVTFSCVTTPTLDIPIGVYIAPPAITGGVNTDPIDEDKFVKWEDSNTLGSKNLLKSYLVTCVINGVTATVNSDGSVTLNGATTDTNGTGFELYRNRTDLPKGKYILSSGVSKGNIYVVAYNGQTYAKHLCTWDGGDNQEFTIDYDGYDSILYGIYVPYGETYNNVTLYPMLRLSSIKDDTYTPYAATNKMLGITETFEFSSYLNNNVFVPWEANACMVTRFGNVAVFNFFGNVTASANVLNKITNTSLPYKTLGSHQYFSCCVSGTTYYDARAWIDINGDIYVWTTVDITNTAAFFQGSVIIR